MNPPNHEDRLDRATSAKLAKLATRPVDTSRLEQSLAQALRSETEREPDTSPLTFRRWWRPITTAAAAILIVVTIGWLTLDGGTSPAMAAPSELAQIHFDVTNDLAPHLKVSSLAEANQLLADQSNGFVPIPELPGELLSCCLHQHVGATLTCALIELDGQFITVAMADGAKIHSPDGKIITRGGKQFIAHTTNGINMVMANEGKRWLCVMGEKSIEELIDVAIDIKM